jgi:hypothetical protein
MCVYNGTFLEALRKLCTSCAVLRIQTRCKHKKEGKILTAWRSDISEQNAALITLTSYDKDGEVVK